jgi:threonine/homoserine/homoserine lactone efflux protein
MALCRPSRRARKRWRRWPKRDKPQSPLHRDRVVNFLPSLAVILAFSAAGLLLSVTPGPDMALFLSKTLSGGKRFGFAALGGVLVGLVVHAFAAALGLSALLAASSQAYGIVKLFGAAYLLWLAFSALRHGSVLHVDGALQPPASLLATFLTGLGINLTNPKIIIFFVTFLPQFIEAGDPHAAGKFLFLGIYFLCIGGLVSAAMILAAARFIAAARTHPRAMRAFDFGFAGLMSAFAARLIFAQGR